MSSPTIIRLSVSNPSKYQRLAEPVTIGVSLPQGEASSDATWSLVDESGKQLTAQATVLERWSDHSVRWILLDFQADVAADGVTWYSLVNGAVTPKSRLTVVPSIDGLAIDTGLAKFIVPRRGAAAVLQADVGGETVFRNLTVVAADDVGHQHRLDIRESTIVRSGELSLVVRLDGALVDSDDNEWVAATVTLQFYAGLGAVRVEVLCANRRAAEHPDGLWDLGDPGSVLIRDLFVSLRPEDRPLQSLEASLERDRPMAPAGERFEVYQDSSGGENWHSANHVNRDGKVATTFCGFRSQSGIAEITGRRATPIASLNAGDSRITIATAQFWEVFPKALMISSEACVVGILPGHSSYCHELQGGERTTYAFTLAVGDDPVSGEPLGWVRSPLNVAVDPEVFRRAGTWYPLAIGSEAARRKYDDLVEGVVAGEGAFSRRREVIDEYGWRNFGEIYADHESVSSPGLISHYNNQYDAIAGMATRFMQTGDSRWSAAMRELAAHVIDVDLYHSSRDKAAYNGGYFWHTQHYVGAGTGTHRSYSRRSVSSGGGPSAEHNYSSGLLLHYYLTGSWQSRDAVLELGEWVLNMDDGRKGPFRWLDRGDTGLASATRSMDFHGPGRGAGNSINALLDAHRISGDARYLAKAEDLILRCAHPDDDHDALELLDAENRWSYTVFLQVLGKYLDYRTNRGLVDEAYAYARQVLLRYARWMADHERPYLERPEELEYPNETWAAQDLRKAAVFEFAALYADDATDRETFLGRATSFFDYSTTLLAQAETGRLVRPLVLLLAYGFQRPNAELSRTLPGPPAPPRAKVQFVPLRRRVFRRLALIAVAGLVALLSAVVWLFLQ